MLILWDARLVLFSVPKTGTTALEAALAPMAAIALSRPPTLKHMTVRRFERVMLPLLRAEGAEGFDRVAVMREPVSWLGSWFRYRQREALRGHPNSTYGMKFDGFVRDCLRKKPPPHADIGRQYRFLTTARGQVGVTHLFRYEDQEKLLSFLAERLGQHIQLEQRNVSPTAETGLPSGLRNRLEQSIPEDFALWAALATDTL